MIHVCLNNLYFAEDINTWLNRGGGAGGGEKDRTIPFHVYFNAFKCKSRDGKTVGKSIAHTGNAIYKLFKK